MDLDDFQRRGELTDIRPDPADLAYPLLGLAGEVGELVSEYKKRLRAGDSYEGFAEEVSEELGDLLWYVAALARTLGLSLSDVAEANLRKTQLVFGQSLPAAPQYDAAFPIDQRLPTTFRVQFRPEVVSGISRVQMYLDDEQRLGDPLDDNAYEDDGYRFHDVLHLANASVLGWSPLLRRLLRRKRKASVQADRIEDGARAAFLEEGLVAYVFTEGSRVGFFKEAERVNWDLLKTLKRMTAKLEVGDQPPIAWQAMILQGFAAWRLLCEHDGGIVEGNLSERSLRYVGPLASNPD